jgi:hypothetical protein
MKVPSIKQLETIAAERAAELRAILEITKRDALEAALDSGKYPVTANIYQSCYHPLELRTTKLSIASEIIGGYGVEYIPAGRGKRSPSIEYVNAGDSYAATLMRVNGDYKVGCWGDIVERGNYS